MSWSATPSAGSIYGEDDKLVNAKAKKAVEHGLTPIVCVGEGIEVREELDQVAFTIAHVEEALGGLTLEQIGSRSSSPTSRSGPSAPVGSPPRRTPRRSAAPSVNGSAWHDAAARPGPADPVRRLGQGRQRRGHHGPADVDGCLVGGASLVIEEFAAIARFYDLPVL